MLFATRALAGTAAQPFNFTWTPDAATPAQLYYGSTSQPNYGGVIEVLDANSTELPAAACSKTHPYVGKTMPMTTYDHFVPGSVLTVLDDCTFQVTKVK
jgi:hypothetical protein